MNNSSVALSVLDEYKNGKRFFENLYIFNESFEGKILEDIVFQDCTLYANFRNANLRNAKFQNGGIKTCDFRGADLTGARFENLSVEGTQFARAITSRVFWENNFAYGSVSTQEDFESWIKDHEE
ncbi:pentapeptide repeat-containing protein [Massilia sp. P8910]|uniref:pentapeptide repeat-containing protein n=1 Tax=Massilia antarctica TaxID=2765360 RepID=UPI001E61BC2A|nr:pentapeptide repeat-containing protein [Massilia antarctica]MCE3602705.1 pentapeptide repeat-containing protein [Massilia antarctica]